ncbi:disease resistance protein [Striga asiatica]|uniref:Disease resistance protein n=1 Tax=Striga asiatica TaxID=4170 RepID=A0A5A7Q9M4_STRAF|nr:disease resistance protein [Striga asiatica]
MVAAYAAVISLMHTIDQTLRHDHHLNCLERQRLETLQEIVSFLLEFLLGGINGEEGFDNQIADAASAAEDAIESHFVDRTLAGSTGQLDDDDGSIFFHQGLEKIIKDLNFITKEAIKMKDKIKYGIKETLPRNSTPASSSRSFLDDGNKMVGFDGELIQILEILAGTQPARQIVPIVGMGGIGKTTLAKNVYDHPLIVQHFDTRAWATVSQEYNLRDILLRILFCQRKQGPNEDLIDFCAKMGGKSKEDLGLQLHKSLSGRRYLIVMDDLWSTDVWDRIKMFFPDNNSRSRIVVTTRLSSVGTYVSSSSFHMKLLNLENSWDLLCDKVFGRELCPLELEQIGKKIVENCKGLPLSIVVTAGLLARTDKSLEYWGHIAEGVSSFPHSDDYEHCLKVLSLSYIQLPVHLKPCFLYIGVFPEDHEIRVSELTKLWVAEGFVELTRHKSMEETAEDFLHELIERNVVLVCEWGSSGKVKSCNIHDLFRELCLREAQKEKFFSVMRVHSLDDVPQGMTMNNARRVVINQSMSEDKYGSEVIHALQSASLARTLICNFDQVLPPFAFKLLRVLKMVNEYSHKPKKEEEEEDMNLLGVAFQFVNSRYLAFRTEWKLNSQFPSSMFLLKNLQTLVVKGTWGTTIAPPEIWNMTQLRHIKFDVILLPDPPSGNMDKGDNLVLSNLQTLVDVGNFRFSQEVVKKIPNITKLRITYARYGRYKEWPYYCLDNLGRSLKLRSLTLFFQHYKVSRGLLLKNLSFPISLKKLTLHGCGLFWEDMPLIGSLPNLEVLKLELESFVGPDWNPVEGEFLCLKFLQVAWCKDLVNWNAERTHFPRLECLVLQMLTSLNEIPMDIGHIPTLRVIRLELCSDSAVISAKNILDEQEELGNVGLRVQAQIWQKNELESLTSENFQVQQHTLNLIKNGTECLSSTDGER